MRSSGILLPIFSLPGRYGIGTFSDEALRFIDFMAEAGQHYWQILPLGPTGYGDSPYQSVSLKAGNPYLISLEKLIGQGLLTEAECDEADLGEDDQCIDYGKLYKNRYALLRTAFGRFKPEENEAYALFLKENEGWLHDYALFMAIKDENEGRPLSRWDDELRLRKADALSKAEARLKTEVCFWEFLQYLFYSQWDEVMAYAHKKGIEIIGDIPIYASADSVEMWVHPELFQLDDNRQMSAVAGCPPDGFSASGQLWGNPLYDWDYHKKTGFSWWIDRLRHISRLYDVVRIDHFRGFDEYYSIPAEAADARGGHWEKGPGLDLFRAAADALGEQRIIAEDLGYVTDSVKKLVKDTGFANMKVFQFAFDARDTGNSQDYLPDNYPANCVAYTGTHDNETMRGWLDHIRPEELNRLAAYLRRPADDKEGLVEAAVSCLYSSRADTVIIPMQDLLGLGNEARINQPSLSGDNWKWRLQCDALSDMILARKLFRAAAGSHR